MHATANRLRTEFEREAQQRRPQAGAAREAALVGWRRLFGIRRSTEAALREQARVLGNHRHARAWEAELPRGQPGRESQRRGWASGKRNSASARREEVEFQRREHQGRGVGAAWTAPPPPRRIPHKICRELLRWRCHEALSGPRRSRYRSSGAPRSGTTLLRIMLMLIPSWQFSRDRVLSLDTTGRSAGCRPRDVLRNNRLPPRRRPGRTSTSPRSSSGATERHEPFTLSAGYAPLPALFSGSASAGDNMPLHSPSWIGSSDAPEAHFIHILRDGRDVRPSLRPMWFSPGWEVEVQARTGASSYPRRALTARRVEIISRSDTRS